MRLTQYFPLRESRKGRCVVTELSQLLMWGLILTTWLGKKLNLANVSTRDDIQLPYLRRTQLYPRDTHTAKVLS